MLILNHVPILLLSNRAFYDLPMSCFVQVFFFPGFMKQHIQIFQKMNARLQLKTKGCSLDLV